MCAECDFSSMINAFLSQGFCISIYLLVRVRLPVCLFRSLSVLDCALVFESHSGILCVLESNCATDCFLLKFFVFLFKYLPGSTVQYIFFISIMSLCYILFTKHTSIPTEGGGGQSWLGLGTGAVGWGSEGKRRSNI